MTPYKARFPYKACRAIKDAVVVCLFVIWVLGFFPFLIFSFPTLVAIYRLVTIYSLVAK